MHIAGSDMVLELEVVANHLFDTEVQRNRTEREIRRSRHENVPIAEIPRQIDQILRPRKNRRL